MEARQRGRSPTVLGCGRLELKKRPRGPERSDDRAGRDSRARGPRGSDQETGTEKHHQEARRACSGGKAGAEERRGSAKRTWLRKTEQETALDVRNSELKRELKETKRARQQDLKDVAGGDTLYGAAFVRPPKRQKRSRSGSWSSSVFRGARGRDHDPVASKLAVWAKSSPGVLAAHTLQRMAHQLSREGHRRDRRPVDCPPVATSHLHQIL